MLSQIDMPDGLLSDLPDELPFHLPNDSRKTSLMRDESGSPKIVSVVVSEPTPPTPLQTESDLLYRQLICWCQVQRFWYFVMQEPKFCDTDYDFIEQHVARLERQYPELKNPKVSPTCTVGSALWWDKQYNIIIQLFNKSIRFQEMLKEQELRVRRRVQTEWDRVRKLR